MESVNALMSGLIDYAGLFPPAGLGMREAVASYAEYVSGPDSRALGSFVLPVEKLPEFDSAATDLIGRSGREWRLSLVVKSDLASAVSPEGNLLASSAHSRVRITGVEMPLDVFDAMASVSFEAASFDAYVEVPLASDVERTLPRLAARGARAKMRTGGITEESFPSTYHVIRFLRCCRDTGTAFKATAGLHHPLRGEFSLTYEAESRRAKMFGFLNVFLAAAFLWNGADDSTAAKILEEADAEALSFSEKSVSWRGEELSTNRLAAARESFARSFGSCSFQEPVDEMKLLLSAAAA